MDRLNDWLDRVGEWLAPWFEVVLIGVCFGLLVVYLIGVFMGVF